MVELIVLLIVLSIIYKFIKNNFGSIIFIGSVIVIVYYLSMKWILIIGGGLFILFVIAWIIDASAASSKNPKDMVLNYFSRNKGFASEKDLKNLIQSQDKYISIINDLLSSGLIVMVLSKTDNGDGALYKLSSGSASNEISCD